MSGVTILSQTTTYWFQIVGFICLIIGSFAALVTFYDEHKICGTLCCIVAIFGLYNLINPIPTWKEIDYKVTIDSNVKMSDFYQHYTVISQEGKIYTVKENN